MKLKKISSPIMAANYSEEKRAEPHVIPRNKAILDHSCYGIELSCETISTRVLVLVGAKFLLLFSLLICWGISGTISSYYREG